MVNASAGFPFFTDGSYHSYRYGSTQSALRL